MNPEGEVLDLLPQDIVGWLGYDEDADFSSDMLSGTDMVLPPLQTENVEQSTTTIIPVDKADFHAKLSFDFYTPKDLMDGASSGRLEQEEEEEGRGGGDDGDDRSTSSRFQLIQRIKAGYEKHLVVKEKHKILLDVIERHHMKNTTRFMFTYQVTNQVEKVFFEKLQKWKAMEQTCSFYQKFIPTMHQVYAPRLRRLEKLYDETLTILETKLTERNQKVASGFETPNRQQPRERYITQLIESLKRQMSTFYTLIQCKEQFNRSYEQLKLDRSHIVNPMMTPEEYESFRNERFMRADRLCALQVACVDNIPISKPVATKPCAHEIITLRKKITDTMRSNAALDKMLRLPETYEDFLNMQINMYPKLKKKCDEELKQGEETICKLTKLLS
ncbi:hypothetical protein M8J76_017089 [Diaphorina citri]|nr:hypothetical protein M8J75_006373 [Diaphorina citri]KAI5724214.1 hypothetical protein M8J76_017089 [Diaphorina citri]KAI5727460.1 hypothetical protein M8J77_002725 [Diaphorina citri]